MFICHLYITGGCTKKYISVKGKVEHVLIKISLNMKAYSVHPQKFHISPLCLLKSFVRLPMHPRIVENVSVKICYRSEAENYG